MGATQQAFEHFVQTGELVVTLLVPDAEECKFYCSVCKECHINACPTLWGGTPEKFCSH